MPTEEESKDLSSVEHWFKEITASEKEMEKFHRQGKKVIKRFLDQKEDESLHTLNLYHSNIVTIRAMLYGQAPKVDVSRRYEDSADDVARVAAEMLERCLNNDVQFTDDTFTEAIRGSLDDFLIPGMGQAKIRYDASFDEEGNFLSETAPVDYIHWADFLWNAGARTWPEVEWVSFKTYISRGDAEKRWGKEKGDRLEYKSKQARDEREGDANNQLFACVYEIWCRTSRMVYWYAKGMDNLLEKQNDPLQLSKFFPCPQPMLANITTSSLVPKSSYAFGQDLYNQVDILTTRLTMLTKAVKVVGVYDKSSVGVQRMLNEATENELIPVDNWAMFAEKGGIKGQVDWLPIEQIAAVINMLEQTRQGNIALLYQITGMSDILRGSTDPRETKGAQELKSKFASIRVQAMQDLFAKFATDIQKLKAEIISIHYSPETILKQSNIEHTPDAPIAQAGVELLKQPGNAIWKVQIRPESIAMLDYAQLKEERTEYLMAISQFMQSAAPLAQLDKGVTPTLLEMLKWGLAGFKGSQQIEGVLDQAIAGALQAMKEPKEPPPDPKMQEMQAKMQMEQQKMQFQMQLAQQKAQLEMQKIQAEMQQDQVRFQMEMEQEKQKFMMELQRLQMQAKMQNEAAQVDAVMNVAQKIGEQRAIKEEG